MRKPLIAGNWKMFHGPTRAQKLALEIKNGLLGNRSADVVVCPPFVSLAAVREIVRDTPIDLGAQNVFWEEEGAWTGEVCAPMLRDAGCTHVIVGHSERRQHFGETNKTVHRRVRAALDANLRPIVCAGETLEEREAGETDRVVESQIREGLAGFSATDWETLTIAYEPVWAIGTGRNATPEQAQDVHRMIRSLVTSLAGRTFAESIRILYGGSVKPENAGLLLREPDIDGALVGGASLQAPSFLGIVEATQTTD